MFPNVLKQVFGKQATQLYGVAFTGTGLASLFIVGLVESPVGTQYYVLFYIFGALALCAGLVLVFFFKQVRFQPNWTLIFVNDTAYV